MVNSFSIFEIAVFVVLIQPATYILFKHGRKGILGWYYIQVLCLVRVVGNILILKYGTQSMAGTIITSIGLAPLLLGSAGILHEARQARHPKLHRGKEWCFVINFHGLASLGMVLVVIGIVGLINQKLTSGNKLLMHLGLAILIITYITLVAWTAFSYTSSQMELDSQAFTDGTLLLQAVRLALPLIGVRLIYGIISFSLEINGHKYSTFATSTALKYIMSAIQEIIVVSMYCVTGVRTRHISKTFKEIKYKGLVGSQQQGINQEQEVPLAYVAGSSQQQGVYEPYKQQSEPYVSQMRA